MTHPWAHIRERWAEVLPSILAGKRPDPYFMTWDFTPIEREAWCSIRHYGLPLYPQCPVGRFFLDFGDPRKKIGVELDGKDFHDGGRDTARDAELWEMGWRIFRISGSDAMRLGDPDCLSQLCDIERGSDEYDAALFDFATSTGDGALWSLNALLYHPERFNHMELASAFASLNVRRLIQFPLPDEE